MSADTKTKTPVKLKASDPTPVLDRLARMINRADDFVLGFVKCNHPSQQKELRREFLARLSDKHILEVELDKPLVSLLDELTARWPSDNPPDVVCVYGLEKSINKLQEASPVLGRLNNDRDLLRRVVPVPLLIWLPDFALDFIARGAPDFWAWRSGVYEFETDKALWQQEGALALIPDVLGVFSLDHQGKKAEIVHLEELLRTAQSLPREEKREKQLTASLLQQLGLIYLTMGQWAEAETHYRKSLTILQDLGEQNAVAVALHQLGRIGQERNDLPEAEHFYRQSLQISQELGERSGIAATLHELATLEQKRANPLKAERLYRQSLQISQELGNKRDIASTLQQLGQIEHDRDNLPVAERLYRQSLQISQELGDESNIASGLYQLARLASQRGNSPEAEHLYHQSLQISVDLGDIGGVASSHSQLGRLYQEQGQLREAIEHYLPAWSSFYEMHSPYAQLARKYIQEVWEEVGEEQFNQWLAEEFGSKATEVRKKLDNALVVTSDAVRQEPAAIV